MAQTKNKRRRKHRGTPAGTIDRAGRTGKGQVRQDAKEIARDRRAARLDREPSWNSAATRAAVAALVFGVLLVALMDYEIGPALGVTAFIFLLYIPAGYFMDRAIFNFRRRRRG
jgi:hypothetical protein